MREFMKKVWLKAVKRVSGNSLNLCVKRRQNPPTSPPKLLCRSFSPSFWFNLRSSSKRETHVLEITTFCQRLICCSVQDLYLNKVILRGVITSSISARWQQRNLDSESPEIRCVNNSRWGGGAALSRLVFLLLCKRFNNFRTTALFFDTATWR